MRRPLILAALLGTCFATPAMADVTVRYSAVIPQSATAGASQNVPSLTIAADGAGQARWDMAAPGTPAPGARQPSVALITREGVGYFALNGPAPGLQIIGRVDDAFAIGAEFAAPILQGPARETVRQVMSQRVEIIPVGPEVVSGVQGNLYRIVVVSGETRSAPFEMVVATDPRLAPIGQEFVRMIESVRPTLVAAAGGEPQLYTAMRGMFGLGAPLRIGDVVRIQSLSTDDVPDSQFALPGPAMTRAELQAMATMMMGMMGRGQGMRPPGAPSAGAPSTPAPPATPPANAANPH